MNDIAIVGIACNLPGAKDKYMLWQNLLNAKSSIREVSDDRKDGFKNETILAGFIDDYANFDEAFFGISPREAKYMDPQQRLFLQVAWQAIEDSGIAIDSLSGKSVGVYVGVMGNEWGRILFNDIDGIDIHSGTGNGYCMVANRVSYVFNFVGPSIAIDTACSSSLVAIDYACRALECDEIDLAIVGGVNLILTPGLSKFYDKAGLSSKIGKCQPFGEFADGIVRGEGVAAVVMKKIISSTENISSDRVYAYVKGCAVNHNGTSNGITAPNRLAQKNVISMALKKANISPYKIYYVEAHGTGTKLGDPIEANALYDAVGQFKGNDKLLIGSIKSNIGHLEGAAGIAGLIKMALSIYYKTIPASLHFHKGNSYIKFDKNNLEVVKSNIDISHLNSDNYFGVSSFGLGGANAHVVLGMANKNLEQDTKSHKDEIIKLSGKSVNSLQYNINQFAKFSNIQHEYKYIASLNNKIDHQNRVAFIGKSTQEIKENIKLSPEFSGSKNFSYNKVAFILPGQGVQFMGMGHDLYNHMPIFKKIVDFIDGFMFSRLGFKLSDIILEKSHGDFINDTKYTQPILFAFEYALAQMWLELDIKPNYLIGHSLGEYVAFCLSGAFDFNVGLELVIERGRLMGLADDGGMLLIVDNRSKIEDLLKEYSFNLSIAVVNSINNIVVAGMKIEILKLKKILDLKSITNKDLNVSGAFHSALMTDAAEKFKTFCKNFTFAQLTIPVVSNVTADIIDKVDAEYLANHLLEPVNFHQAIVNSHTLGVDVFLEVGPSDNFTKMVKSSVSKEVLALATISKENSYKKYLTTIKVLYESGMPFNWKKFSQIRQLVDAPVYQFNDNKYILSISGQNSFIAKPSLISNKEGNSFINNNICTSYIDDIEKQIVKIISDVCEIEATTILKQHNFITDLSFDSLMLVDLRSKINKIGFTGEKYNLASLLKLKTVEELLLYIKKNQIMEQSNECN